MDNRDFWPYMRVAKLPDFNSSLLQSSPSSSSSSFFSWFIARFRSVYRYCYVHLHDLILSSMLGYMTLNERLYVAVHENDLHKARQLLSHGAKPSYVPIDYKSIFTHLIKNNHQTKNYYFERSLLSSILAADSMLYMAVSNNNFRLIKDLVRYHDYGQIGCHTEVVSLCLAVKRCYFPIVEYLIDYAHINPNDAVRLDCKHCKTASESVQRYQFPLYHACRENHINLVKYLIEVQQCDINQLTRSCETCLHGAILGAIENPFDTSCSNQQRFFIVKYLLTRSDCNPNLGLNPLCVSLAHDNIYDYTSLLLEYKCDANRLGWNRYESTKSRRQDSHLLYSLDHPLCICLRRLCITNDNSPVTEHFYHKKHALNLIRDNANIYAMFDYGSTYPFLLAVQTGDRAIVDAMLSQAASYIRLDVIEPLVHACTKSYSEIVQLLVEFGFDPNTVTTNWNTQVITNPSLTELSQPDFLHYLDRYCTLPVRSTTDSTDAFQEQQQVTALLALSRMSPWIFHPDKYDATMNTLEHLFSRVPVDFTVRSNRLAFHHALLNEHTPIVYICLVNFCPVDLPHNTLSFNNIRVRNHFSCTLFHLISVCARLTLDTHVKHALFDAYARTILHIVSYDHSSSLRNVLAYMQLWLRDEDFVYDQTLFEHLATLPYLDEILRTYDERTLRASFGDFYQRIIARRPRSRPIHTLKHLCRMQIQQLSQAYCERQGINMLKVLPQFHGYLCPSLRAYLFYTRVRSNSLINFLLSNEACHRIAWM